MDYQEIVLKEYYSYLESKDRFVDRSFLVNRFYLIIVFALLLFTFWQLDNLRDSFTMLFVISTALGMCSSLLWVLNQDAYAYLIKVKLSSVVEKLEEKLPVQPHVLEYEAIKEHNKKKRVMFVDIQKGVGFIAFLVFFSLFLVSAGTRFALMLSSIIFGN